MVCQSMNDYFKLIDSDSTNKARMKNHKKQPSLPKVRVSGARTRRKFNSTNNTSKTKQKDRKTNIQKMKQI